MPEETDRGNVLREDRCRVRRRQVRHVERNLILAVSESVDEARLGSIGAESPVDRAEFVLVHAGNGLEWERRLEDALFGRDAGHAVDVDLGAPLRDERHEREVLSRRTEL